MDDYDRYRLKELTQRIYGLLLDARDLNEEGQKTRSRELSLVITDLEQAWLRSASVSDLIGPEAYRA